jgi:hypothetical protein
MGYFNLKYITWKNVEAIEEWERNSKGKNVEAKKKFVVQINMYKWQLN